MKGFQLACLAAVVALPACAATQSSVPGHTESHHHVRFQNGYVRVMETRLEPGQETLAHSHPIGAAVVFLTPGQLRVRNDDGTIHEASLEPGSVAFGSATPVHRAANIGEETVRVISVEIFSQPPTRSSMTALPSPGELLLENHKVRLSRIRLSPGEAIHLSGATPSVVVAMNKGTVAFGGSATRLESGQTRWCDAGPLELRNDGEAAFEAIIVTLEPRA